MRIELTYPAWKAGVLPLNYTRVISDTIGILSYIPNVCKYFFQLFLFYLYITVQPYFGWLNRHIFPFYSCRLLTN